jgi:hypothetical protein
MVHKAANFWLPIGQRRLASVLGAAPHLQQLTATVLFRMTLAATTIFTEHAFATTTSVPKCKHL